MKRSLKALLASLLLSGSLGATGCGFTPLYAAHGVVPALQAIDVTTPQTRMGYFLREQINDEFGRNLDTGPRFRLALTVSEGRIPSIRVNNVANMYVIALTVDFSLTDISTGKVVFTGREQVNVSYDAPDPPYASVVAHEDGEERAANAAAVRLRLDLSRYFHGQAKG